MSFDAENTTAESLELAEQQRDPLKLQQQIKQETMRETVRETRERPLQLQTQLDPLQLQIQQRAEREHLQHREKMQMHQREHIAQLQSINNLLLDLPPAAKGPYQSARGHESPYSQSLKGSEGKTIQINGINVFRPKYFLFNRTCSSFIYLKVNVMLRECRSVFLK